ncbi:peptidoglycan-binding domain-containing protein [Sphingomonas sp.]|uniref:peptidoglycan-binding domain-containing protein n=1 Tax=Sphingomonas sp. TaxID=28214 RepID=UPI003D6D77E8
MGRLRLLSAQERSLASSVYGTSLPYDRVYISDWKIGSTAVTLAGVNLADGRFIYRICWPQGFLNIMNSLALRTTLIHELCHVWQGHHGVWPTFYMGQSILDQIEEGVRDIIKKREYRRWDEHRSGAYTLHGDDWGKKWSEFGVEQQASLVESWFLSEPDRRRLKWDFGPGVIGGGASPLDPRFPYIRDVIRVGKRQAPYRALVTSLTPGGDPAIKAIQERLVALGYLEPRYADGLIGRKRSATLDAVAEFQKRNSLKVDRDLGGPNSETRRRLALPIGQLIAAP